MNATERMVGAHTRSADRSRWGALTDWRNWSLPVKFGAVMLVPTVLAVVLGVVVIRGQVAVAAAYTGSDQRTDLAERVRAVVAQLQTERVFEANSRVPGNPVTDRLQRQQAAKVDRAIAAAREAFDINSGIDPTAEDAWVTADRQLDRLVSIRETARSPILVPSTIAGYYTDIMTSLLDLERTLLSKVGDAELSAMATATYDLDAAREEVSMQQATVLVGLARNDLLPDETEQLRSSSVRYDDLIDDFRSVADADAVQLFDDTVSGNLVDRRPTLLTDVLLSQGAGAQDTSASGRAGRSSVGVEAAPWNLTSRTAVAKLGKVADTVSDQLRARATSLQQGASDRAGLIAVLLFITLLAAAAVVVVMARQLLSSVGTLHRTARTLAEHELPEAVADIRAGRAVSTEVTPVPVRTDEEIGQLARAFDAVHAEARRLAVEQASMRTNYGNVFTNLSRRSQSLVQRQLRLIEKLERDEEDPDQLSTLFQLDHLATRMRRNNENLMVLSGSDTGRERGQQPASLADLLRAGASEIEQYQRVELQPPPNVQIVGYAAGDIVRLTAELLDNATAFSAPETQVAVSGYLSSEGAVVVDIIDNGVGMVAAELQAANEVLAAAGADDVPASRRMGLFVVNRLAGRHNITVRLHGGEGIDGVRACVTIPSGLIASIDEPTGELDGGQHESGSVPKSGPNQPAVPSQQREQASAAYSTPDPVAEPPAASSPADSLFSPANKAPRKPEPEEPKRDGSETTPIFDEMISAWFVPQSPVERKPQPSRDAHHEPRNGVSGTNGHNVTAGNNGTNARRGNNGAAVNGSGVNGSGPHSAAEFDMWSASSREAGADGQHAAWQFAADEGWEASKAASESEPAEFTEAGLPRRTPKARLVPGSVAGAEEQDQSPAPRDADDVRDRLASFQRGVEGGRSSSDEHGASAAQSGSAAPEVEQRDAQAADTELFGTAESDVDEGVSDSDDARWQFAADEGWRAVEAASKSAPEDLTPAGLPKRTPRARLVPGSANGGEPTQVSGRDPESVRHRLGSFQRGIEDGRHSVRGPAQDTLEYGDTWEKE